MDWPSREEWAKQRRTMQYHQCPDVSVALSDYASAAEIADLAEAFHQRWKDLGRVMRRLGGQGADGTYELWDKRRSINRGLRLIDNGEMPLCLEDHNGASDLLQELHSRYEAAKAKAIAHREGEIAQTPIDDAAWAAELQRRARFQRYEKMIDSGEHIQRK